MRWPSVRKLYSRAAADILAILQALQEEDKGEYERVENTMYRASNMVGGGM